MKAKLKKYVAWYGLENDGDPKIDTSYQVEAWLIKRFPYRIEFDMSGTLDWPGMESVDNFTQGRWSAFTSQRGLKTKAILFFKEESDALAFKLKWM